MDLDSLVGQLFLIGIKGKEVDEETLRVLRFVKPGFVILFARNVETPKQVLSLVKQVRSVLNEDVVFAVDQEGGIVTRFREGFAVSPGAMAIAATGNAENAYRAAKVLAREMRAVGVSWNLAPVVDINDNPNNPGIGVRSFSDRPDVVAQFATRFYEGLKEENVASCAKHFPGKGSVSLDAHLEMPTLDKSLEDLDGWEFVPFKTLIEKGIDSIMPSHVYLPKIQSTKEPATVSHEIVTKILRERLKYDGIAVADDLLMGGIVKNMTVEEAVVKSFAAGMDVMTVCHEPDAQISSKRTLLKRIEQDALLQKRLEESIRRIQRFKQKFAIKDLPDEIHFDPENQRIMQEIAENSITLVSDRDGMLPLRLDENDSVFAVKLSRLVQVQESDVGVPWVAEQIATRFNCKLSVLDENTKIEEGYRCVVFTENAHLSNWQKQLLFQVRKKFKKVLLVALRNPYDCNLIESSSICTYGYEMVSQKALLKVLLGELKPVGKLPVEVFK
ncbi:MAG: Glycoside hydrolase family 3 domain protein [Thermotoga sp. 50_1627]|uniref:beta-N-acetylhexosaminidase n=1 Tax=Pseudothermotoga sp. TaxID=2033661 RepID=UPI00076CA4BD|nr:MAG: Glycoside hydrolase family 3 domain protein [Thermotoga sp. 50_64]KUK24023.1 MAG: Glycoside hydrolase family 3 domain protein [Thermotoga sp. 50_1627]MBC7116528.1 beta-N-acetylhexosaminidase [Pseudothermotoga sp.]HBT39351.1 beta-N-acetylhexosaminidase [Pseudothermotoga sp.]HCO97566.1 beta-N-acetylhexosaminidase [Pseudothermotoga sp.]